MEGNTEKKKEGKMRETEGNKEIKKHGREKEGRKISTGEKKAGIKVRREGGKIRSVGMKDKQE